MAQTWFSPYAIGVREISDVAYEALWKAAGWEAKFANDVERANLEWDKLMNGRK